MAQQAATREQNTFQSAATPADLRSYRPLIFSYEDEALHDILEHARPVFHDEIVDQIKGLIKIRNPRMSGNSDFLEQKYNDWLQQYRPEQYGVYVYYPWSNRLVHLLPEEEFVELRTARNRYKITGSEQRELSEKCVGVIGLSVGQNVALTMALERSCGYLKLADFDSLELSNLNRIKTGVQSLGLPKTIIAAREIAEIDPFIELELYPQGITPENIDDFFDASPGLDLLIEECDDLAIKILARKAARDRSLPVLMDTSDRGMLDVERFDLEPKRELLHGLVPRLDELKVDELAMDERIGILLKLVGGLSISDRLKASLVELNQSIGSWPQLSSAVSLGGGITGDVARRILLGVPVDSGRFYADPEQIVKQKPAELPDFSPPESVSPEKMKELLQPYQDRRRAHPPEELMHRAVTMAGLAPSSGNDQPWLFYNDRGLLGVFHNPEKAYSFGDHKNYASYQSIGAAIENLRIFMSSEAYGCEIEYPEPGDADTMVAVISFQERDKGAEEDAALVSAIETRITNREISERKEVSEDILQHGQQLIASYGGMKLHWLTDEQDLLKQGEIIAKCDKIRVFNQWGHRDFFEREMRWTPAEAEETADGIDIRTLGIDPQKMLAIQILRNYRVVSTLADIDGGKAFDAIAMDAARKASAIGLVTAPNLKASCLLEGGRAWEKLWLDFTNKDLAFHPLISPLYLFNRLNNEGDDVLDRPALDKLQSLYPDFRSLWQLEADEPIFMFRIFYTDKRPMRSHRLPTDKIYFSDGH